MGWSELQLQVRDECLRLLDLALAECTDARSTLHRALSLLDAEAASEAAAERAKAKAKED